MGILLAEDTRSEEIFAISLIGKNLLMNRRMSCKAGGKTKNLLWDHVCPRIMIMITIITIMTITATEIVANF